MPINIYKRGEPGQANEEVDWVCDGVWELSDQIYALEAWLQANNSSAPNSHIADIGYSVRQSAIGGGGVFTLEMMKNLVDLGMEVHFSEYPWGDEDSAN